MINKTAIVLFLLIFSITFAIADFGFYDETKPKIVGATPTTTTTSNVNYSTVNVNNSQYLQGYNWSTNPWYQFWYNHSSYIINTYGKWFYNMTQNLFDQDLNTYNNVTFVQENVTLGTAYNLIGECLDSYGYGVQSCDSIYDAGTCGGVGCNWNDGMCEGTFSCLAVTNPDYCFDVSDNYGLCGYWSEYDGGTYRAGRFNSGDELYMSSTDNFDGSSSDGGYYFRSFYDIASGLITEVGGQLLTFGINVGQVGTRDNARAGIIYRLDTRSDQNRFVAISYPAGNDSSGWFQLFYASTTNGNFIIAPATGNAMPNPRGYVGIGTDTPSERITVVGNGSFTQSVLIGQNNTVRNWIFGNLVNATNITSSFINLTSDYALILSGNATVFNDMVAPLTVAHLGASAPTFNENEKAYAFADGATEQYAFVSMQLPHSYKEGTNISCHLHTRPTTTMKANATFEINYTWFNIGQTSVGTTTYTLTQNFSSGVAYNNTLYDFQDLSGIGKTMSSSVLMKVTRKSNVASDTFTGDVLVDFADCHYEQDNLGSRGEYVK